ncbi:YIF1-domain-containing protein [Suillus occidentalis]|nr:YIF1-domain-containing protein [Suillus occidentalis]
MSYYSRSPPPLQHPVPTHPAFIPEPPSMPASPQGYQRFASSSPPNQQYAAQTQYNPPPFQPIPNPQHQHIPDFAAWGMNDTTSVRNALGSNGCCCRQRISLIPMSCTNSSSSFPLRHKTWTRKVRCTEAGHTEWQPPRDDINSPDLYVPFMALVTYILVAALQMGLQERFHPQILCACATPALVIVVHIQSPRRSCFASSGSAIANIFAQISRTSHITSRQFTLPEVPTVLPRFP